DDPQVQAQLGQPPLGSPQYLALLRRFLQAAASGDPATRREVMQSVVVGVDQHWVPHIVALELLAAGGDLDGAFREAARAITPAMLDGPSSPASGGVGVLFKPGTASMRRDRRFMALAARIGLVDYWRASGHWPDFCSEPGLPYDCKAEAAKYATSAPAG